VFEERLKCSINFAFVWFMDKGSGKVPLILANQHKAFEGSVLFVVVDDFHSHHGTALKKQKCWEPATS